MCDLTLHFVSLQTSDEAVSDLSSLSDESTNERHSFEDQIAQAVVSKVCFLCVKSTHWRRNTNSPEYPTNCLYNNTRCSPAEKSIFFTFDSKLKVFTDSF